MRKVQDKLYLDSASTTSIHPEIIKDVTYLLKHNYANADSLYNLGQQNNKLVEKSRKALAQHFNVLPKEVVFTSGGTESNNNAIKGIALANQHKGKHIITTNMEHSSVYESCKWLEDNFGFEVTYLNVDKDGHIDEDVLINSLRKDTVLVSFIAVNNETGAIIDINKYVGIVKRYSDAFVHVDGVQALGKHDITLNRIDSGSFSAHKIGGLKGSGLWIIKMHVPVIPLISGGQQENGIRGGTLNHIAAIVWYKTLRLAIQKHDKHYDEIKLKHKLLYDAFKDKEDKGIYINSSENGSPYIFNMSFKNLGSEILINALENAGYLVSGRATCNSKSLEPSRVILSLTQDTTLAKNTIRLSLDETITIQQIEQLIQTILELEKYVTN